MLGMRIDQQGAIYRRLGDVLNAIPDGVVVVTPEGLISLVNAAGRPLFGPQDSVIGTSIYETLSSDSLADALASARDSDKPIGAILQTVWSDRPPCDGRPHRFGWQRLAALSGDRGGSGGTGA